MRYLVYQYTYSSILGDKDRFKEQFITNAIATDFATEVKVAGGWHDLVEI